MVRLETSVGQLDAVKLGQALEFRLVKEDPAIEARFFLRHRPVIYTRPLADWTTEPGLVVYPEAPGSYTLAAEWRSAGGAAGWEELDFRIVAGENAAAGPCEVELDSGVRIWVANPWEAEHLRDSEKATVGLLEELVEPGATVYDLGANFGVYALQVSRLAGPEGRVYCVEANPVCVQLLRASILAQGLDNVQILPVAVLHHDGRSRFLLNYGNSNLGLSEVSGFYPAKTGHEIWVPCFAFDHLVETFRLRPPDVVKVDVEGAEGWVVEGMRQTLETHRPKLLLELHGESCAAAVLEILDGCGYRYRDPAKRDVLEGAEAVQRRFGDRVYQLLALP